MKILLVEDHEEIWDFLSRRLKRRGFDVAVATDGQEGVDKSRSEAPDIILLDMNLPTLDGWTAAGMMRADPVTAHLPIIAAHGPCHVRGQGEGDRGRLHGLLPEAHRFQRPPSQDRDVRPKA